MFGRNGKISKRQIRRILILEQAAKIGLLLPLPAQIPEGGFSIWSWILTAALTFLYLKIMLDFSKKTAGVSCHRQKKRNGEQSSRKQKGWHRPGGNRNPDRCIWDLRFGRCIFFTLSVC